MMKLCEWIESLQPMKANERVHQFFSLTRSISAPKEFAHEDLPDLIDWQVFMRMILDSYVWLKPAWTKDKNLGCISGLLTDPRKDSLFDQFITIGASSNRFVVALATKIASISDDSKNPKMKLKLSEEEFFTAFPLSFWDGFRQQKLHWTLLQTVNSSAFVEGGLKLICTHNAKDFHSSAKSAANILCAEGQEHPYIGFKQSKRTIFVGCTNGADSFYQGIASMCFAADGRTYSFGEAFAHDHLCDVMIDAGASPAWVASMQAVVDDAFEKPSPSKVDGLLKQIYWTNQDGSHVLMTPMIAGSIQADLHNYFTHSAPKDECDAADFVSTYGKYLKVLRIGSNASNGGRLAGTLDGRHNLIKSFPPPRAPEIYSSFYEFIYGETLHTFIASSRMSYLSHLAVSDFTDEKMQEAVERGANAIADEMAQALRDIVEFGRGKGKTWLENKLIDNQTSAWLNEAIAGALSKTSISALIELILSSHNTEHMNDAVREAIAGALKYQLEQPL
ncbi:hypothetical protein RYA05_06075 [Pseudomonas syringae pv. actinidiae]|nr:hypothetical protein [Pseudomonas syringae pv. actinidiae]